MKKQLKYCLWYLTCSLLFPYLPPFYVKLQNRFHGNKIKVVGLWQALITTALGLLIAIPDHFAFDYLTSRVRHFTDDMSLASSEITELLLEKENA